MRQECFASSVVRVVSKAAKQIAAKAVLLGVL